MPRRPTRKADSGRPQRIIRRWDQHFVARIEQGVHGHDDQLRNAITDVDVFQRHALDMLLLGVMHHRLARGENPLRIRVTRRIRQVANHVELDFFRRVETERGQIADIQLDDLVPLVLHLLGLLQYRSANVIADVGQLVRLEYGFHNDQPMQPAVRQAVLSGCKVNTTKSASFADAVELRCA